jgi:Coenzyme PQQ synthesis protein D (PqqD)
MKHRSWNTGRPKRIDALIRQIENELIVYDARTHRAHCLNEIAAAVWKACDGSTTLSELIRDLQDKARGQLNDRIVRLTVIKLGRAGLLEEPMEWGEQQTTSRRLAIQKIGIAGAVALPIVTSILIPTPAMAASCLPNGQPCSSNAQCCSGICGLLGIHLVCLR